MTTDGGDVWSQLTDRDDVGIWIPTFAPGRTNDPFDPGCTCPHVAYYVVPVDDVRFTSSSHHTSRDYFSGSLYVRTDDCGRVRLQGNEQLPDACERMRLWDTGRRVSHPAI